MKHYHGIRLYAVDSRDVGAFGGSAKRSTLKVYDGSCANTPRTVVSGSMREQVLAALAGKDREQVNHLLRTLLPSNDPYRVEAAL